MKKSKEDVNATELIDQYIENHPDWRGELLAKIRKIFLETDPDVIEEWKWMGSPVWSQHGIIAVGNAHKKKVKLTFQQGAHLDDPDSVFNAGLDGNKWRAIDLFEGDDIDEVALTKLIKSAISYNIQKKKK